MLNIFHYSMIYQTLPQTPMLCITFNITSNGVVCPTQLAISSVFNTPWKWMHLIRAIHGGRNIVVIKFELLLYTVFQDSLALYQFFPHLPAVLPLKNVSTYRQATDFPVSTKCTLWVDASSWKDRTDSSLAWWLRLWLSTHGWDFVHDPRLPYTTCTNAEKKRSRTVAHDIIWYTLTSAPRVVTVHPYMNNT